MGSDSSERYARLNQVLEEVAACYRRGEHPPLQKFLDRYPDLADDIRELAPAMVEIEQVKEDRQECQAREAGPLPALRQLGEYRILGEVGRGGMGIVYEAEQESLGRHVALKVLPAHALLDPRHVQRFQREARAAARLHHTNIVPVFGVGEHDGLHYYAMQFIHGQGLDQVLAELKRLRQVPGKVGPADRTGDHNDPSAPVSQMVQALLSGTFASPALAGWQEKAGADSAPEEKTAGTSETSVGPPLSEVHLPGQPDRSTLSDSGRLYWQSVARIGIQVAEALAYAHSQGTLHRDIKPSNLLLDTQGIVWVTDFGLAKAADSEDLTHSGDVVGTLRYMAPERFQGHADPRSDLYALGLTLYELLTLKPAFEAVERTKLLLQVMSLNPPRPHKLNPLVPRDLETVVLKLMARDPDHRYQNATELAEDLRHFLDDKPIRARQASEAEKLWRWCRRNPALALLSGALLLTLLLGSAATTWKWLEADAERTKVGLAERKATQERDQAMEARNESQRVLAVVMLDKGIALAEQGEVGEGLFSMLQALREVRDNAPELERVIRTNLAAWRNQAHTLRQVRMLPQGISRCAFSADGQRFLTLSSDGVRAWETATGRLLGFPLKRVRGISDERGTVLAVSPDGKWIVAGNSRGGKIFGVQRWDAETGEPIGEPLPHPGEISTVAFTPDGMRFATACGEVVRLWDLATGRLVSDRFQHDRVRVSGLSISPDGKTLAVATVAPEDRKELAQGTYLWDLASGRLLRHLRARREGADSADGKTDLVGMPFSHLDSIQCVAFAPDGKSVLTGSWAGTAQLWAVATGKPIGLPLRHPASVSSVRFSADGRTIVTGGPDGVVRWWAAASSTQLIGTLPLHRGNVVDLAFSPDGKTLVAVSIQDSAGAVHVWEVCRSQSRPFGRGQEVGLRASWVVRDIQPWYDRHGAVYSPDGSRVLTGGMDGFARLHDTTTGEPLLAPLRQTWKGALVLASSPDGRFLATASQDVTAQGDVRLYESATGRPVGPPLPHINWVATMAFSPDSKVLATGGYDHAVHFWDPATGQRIGSFLRQDGVVQRLAFSPDGKTLAVGHARTPSAAAAVVLWDVASRRQIGQKIPGYSDWLRFTPDGQRLFFSEGMSFRLWGAATGQPATAQMTEAADINALDFSRDGKVLLTGCTDGTARLWDVASGKPLGVPLLHAHRLNVVAFSPDSEGRLLLTASTDGSARLWDRATQKPLGPPVFQNRRLVGATFTPDGRYFLTTAEDGCTRRWLVPIPLEDPPDALSLGLQVRAGLEMGTGQTVLQLAPEEWERRRQRLVDTEGSAETALTRSVTDRDFHDGRARDAEQDGALFTALWHLDRLIAAQEQDRQTGNGPSSPSWLAYARRAHIHAVLGQFDQAESDYATALKLSSQEQLLCWYRHRVLDCQAGQCWPAALWYLNRAIAAAPADWELYADRALVHDKLDKTTECEADLERAIEKGADVPFLLRLAGEQAGRGQWDKAEMTFATASARGPLPQGTWQAWALVSLKRDNRPGYRKLCTALLARAGPKPSPRVANAVAWVCALGPGAVDDYTQPLALAERAVKEAPPQEKANILNTLGAVLYRAGRFKEAAGRLHEGIQLRNGQGTAQDWAFLAMAHHRLGEAAEAHKFLARFLESRTDEGRWSNLEVELLRQEARALIEPRIKGSKP